MDDVRKLKILMMCAHPGDALDDSGGTLCHHIERGDDVTVVIVTTGARSHAPLYTDEKSKLEGERNEKFAVMKAEEISDIKAKEIIAAGAELGITDIRFLNGEDGILLVNEPMIKQVGRIIREEKPDVLITHHPNQDGGLLNVHPTVGKIVMLGWETAYAHWTRDETLPPHQVSQVFFIGIVGAKPWTLCNIYHPEYSIFIDITDTVDRKVKALDHLASQHYDGAYARKRIEVADGWRGMRANIPYAETFVPMIPEVHRYLPIMQSTLDTPEDLTSRLARLGKMTPHKVPFKGKQLF